MTQERSTILSDLERLAWWGVRTLGANRHELRDLLRAWVMLDGAPVRADLIGNVADHVHAAHQAGA